MSNWSFFKSAVSFDDESLLNGPFEVKVPDLFFFLVFIVADSVQS